LDTPSYSNHVHFEYSLSVLGMDQNVVLQFLAASSSILVNISTTVTVGHLYGMPEHKRHFMHRMLRKIFVPKEEEVAGGCR